MNKILLLIILTLLSACVNKGEPVYDLPIPRDKLVTIMADLALGDASVTEFNGEKRDSATYYYKHLIENIHGIKMEDIDKTLQILYTDHDLNKIIQKQVVDTLRYMEETWKKNVLEKK